MGGGGGGQRLSNFKIIKFGPLDVIANYIHASDMMKIFQEGKKKEYLKEHEHERDPAESLPASAS